ncbi:MAG: glutamine-hydrolyzing carbamoyl-phosphate synthase small subunit [Polyangiales bacterium]
MSAAVVGSPKRGELVLEDGSRFPGRRFGAEVDVSGEAVFATGMVGYVESLTDPSYCGELLSLTFPLQGNYGVPADGARAHESSRIQAQALIVGRVARHPSHPTSTRSLDAWLAAHDVPGLEGVDTRALTQRLREHGTMRGWLLDAGLEGDALDRAKTGARAIAPSDVAQHVSPKDVRTIGTGDVRLLLVDAGAKEGIVRALNERGAIVVRAGISTDLARIAGEAEVDGVVLSNGPGDPKSLQDGIAKVRALVDAGLPVFGVCLGHQLLTLAMGGDTFKLKYGHRSHNQPVRDATTGRCALTSQNHGYAVGRIPSGFSSWFHNLNDGTNEGIRHDSRLVRSVQFHPEAAPGPEDTRFLFDDFLHDVRAARVGTRGAR